MQMNQIFIYSFLDSDTYAILLEIFENIGRSQCTYLRYVLGIFIKYTCFAFLKCSRVLYANTKTILEIMNGLKKKCNCLLQGACNKILIGRFQK